MYWDRSIWLQIIPCVAVPCCSMGDTHNSVNATYVVVWLCGIKGHWSKMTTSNLYVYACLQMYMHLQYLDS